MLQDGVLISTNGDRHNTGPWSLKGGQTGNLSAYTIVRNGTETRIPAASNFELNKGDRFIVEISGGGGYGNPTARNRDLVANDLICGRITKEAAKKIYGYDGSELAAE